MAKRRITQATPHDSSGTLVFCCRRSRQNSNGVIPKGGAKCRWGRLNVNFLQITRYNSKTSTVASVVNLVRSQVYHSERPPLFAARLPWCSASRGFVSDSWSLLSLILSAMELFSCCQSIFLYTWIWTNENEWVKVIQTRLQNRQHAQNT